MKGRIKPLAKVTIDEVASEGLSATENEWANKLEFLIEIGKPKRFYVHLTKEGFEIQIRWTRAIAGIAGIIGLIKLIF